LYLFVSGALGICAMILPGLSGAFILLLLGVYQTVLQALLAADLAVIAVFGAGCVTGLLMFSRLLAWLLRHFHDLAYSFIMGMLLGSIGLLWPWQQVLLQTTDSSGEVQALKTAPVWPLNYTEVTGQDPALGLCLAALLLGLTVVLLLHRLFHRSKNSEV
jgi:putative membrane protein